jgi:3-oxoacyl-[acyl-carrier-protein] synthase II
MASSSRRAVLTGLGLITPLGLEPGSFWEALRTGRSGVRRIQSFDPSALPTQFGGEILGFDAKHYLDKKERKRLNQMVRTIQFAVAGAQLAMADSGVDRGRLDPTRFGVEYGAGTIPSELEDLGPAAQISANCQSGSIDLRRWGEEGIACIPPMWLLNHVPNMPASHVSILHNAQGPNNTITQTDVGSLLALGEAYRIIERDMADFFLVGGADTMINPISMVRQCLFRPLSRRNDAPQRACRPFDRCRDGQVPAEGAGVFVLEEMEHARRRWARIYAEMAGFGAAFDRSGDKAICGHGAAAIPGASHGLARAIRAALAEAQIGPEDVDHINAQGYSTVESDAWEARGIQEVFGGCHRPVPVFAGKSYFGNLGAGSSTTELAASVLALTHGLLPATLNYEEPDPACPVPVNRTQQAMTRPHVLKVAFTEMGQCAAVVIRRLGEW